MFMQIIQGKVRDAAQMQQQLERWRTDVKPGAIGFLGSTGGITDDGQLIVMARFESEAAAQANSQRPEQGAWWAQTEPVFDGEPTFTDCTEVDTMMGGGSDGAGFVQIMSGRAKDPAAMRAMSESMDEELRGMRPDILGGLVGWHGDRYFTQAIYFITEDAARKGETEMTGDEGSQEWEQMLDGPMSFLDLRSPIYD